LSLLNCSVTPDRFTTASTIVSDVVNRLPHAEHDLRRRIACPSSTSRESTTRESACRQNGHRMAESLPFTSVFEVPDHDSRTTTIRNH
jgi:hypothetical protein